MKLRVRAVNYLNTVPLVYGMLHGPQRETVDLSFSIPSLCAADVEAGNSDVGLVPVAEIARQKLEIAPGVGIAAEGAVRSILLFSKVPFRAIRTLAADESSRTSVRLAQVILRQNYETNPTLRSMPPDLEQMLAVCDAALIIGDPALRIEPAAQPYTYLDLAQEWLALSGLPFVFAAWASKKIITGASDLFTASYRYGREHLDEIIDAEYTRRGITRELASRYLRTHLRFELGERELAGMQEFFRLAEI